MKEVEGVCVLRMRGRTWEGEEELYIHENAVVINAHRFAARANLVIYFFFYLWKPYSYFLGCATSICIRMYIYI